jgi:hypothetical protein
MTTREKASEYYLKEHGADDPDYLIGEQVIDAYITGAESTQQKEAEEADTAAAAADDFVKDMRLALDLSNYSVEDALYVGFKKGFEAGNNVAVNYTQTMKQK